ncbi:MAG TPA: hypothetical protein VK898_02870, partial [Chloroflexota bacterium]|nr:hypothetical protein [Chloroflexota bacterium]
DEPIVVTAQPVVSVLPARFESGLATPHGPQECVAQTAPIYVTGRQIQSVTFYLDGRKVKSVTRADKRGRYGVKVNTRKVRYGAHRIKIMVTFTTSSQTNSTTLHAVIVRCRPFQPKFTG